MKYRVFDGKAQMVRMSGPVAVGHCHLPGPDRKHEFGMAFYKPIRPNHKAISKSARLQVLSQIPAIIPMSDLAGTKSERPELLNMNKNLIDRGLQ
jgi:hypothetical protein